MNGRIKAPCEVCGTWFTPKNPERPSRTCSRPCASRLNWSGRSRRRILWEDGEGYVVEDRGHTTPCWVWAGGTGSRGYASTKVNRKHVLIHRLSYEHYVGPIPEGLEIDHLCRVRNCINPAHLEPVTSHENTMRGTSVAAINAAKTHCKRGHPFDEENTRYVKEGRKCRACHRDQMREHMRQRRKADREARVA